MSDDALPERFASKLAVLDNGCWQWSAAKAKGYGQYRHGGRVKRAHRVAYELLVGPIPEGLTLHHHCRNKACVNPSHLEPMTLKENMHADDVWRGAREKTHCPHGHERSDKNTYVDKRGYKRCRVCLRKYQNAYRAKRRQS